MNFIELTEKQTANLDFEIKDASELLYQEIAIIFEWAEEQDSDFFVDLSLQEVLNVYRVSADYEDFEEFLEMNSEKAVEAYNSAVAEDNRIVVQ